MITYFVGKPKITELPELEEIQLDVPLIDSSNDESEESADSADSNNDKSTDSFESIKSGLTGDTYLTYIGSENSYDSKVDVVTDILMNCIKDLVASRSEDMKRTPADEQAILAMEQFLGAGNMTAYEEVTTSMAPFPRELPQGSGRDPESISLATVVQTQIHKFVETIAEMHNEHPFHAFGHGVQVVHNAQRLLAKTHPILQQRLPIFANDKLSQVALLFG